jgi:hypothetical protein
VLLWGFLLAGTLDKGASAVKQEHETKHAAGE